ncbi:calcium-dependent protein kinase 29-like protein [Corchorus olitorius]|uniref:Calcium-dependent protein kinase 29-like protein n=1 Tax=Corchorus olitorius TaxID=93759 RepID=A0A1R3L0I6_9ROSI|nr:calcium-dependent protein kinase 29-like protein [Corchorus olitorius]
MAFKLNQGGENDWAEAETGQKEDHDVNSREEVYGTKGFQEKKGSGFPRKRKLVKTMMVESVAKCLSSSLSISSNKMQGGGSSKPKGKKSMEIFPRP